MTENLQLLWQKTMPAFPPEGRAGGVRPVLARVAKAHVWFVVPGEPVDEVVQRTHAARCERDGLPAQVVHVLGTQLPEELCDVVLSMSAEWVEVVCGQPRRHGTVSIPCQLHRMDLRAFLSMAEASLGDVPPVIVMPQRRARR